MTRGWERGRFDVRMRVDFEGERKGVVYTQEKDLARYSIATERTLCLSRKAKLTTSANKQNVLLAATCGRKI